MVTNMLLTDQTERKLLPEGNSQCFEMKRKGKRTILYFTELKVAIFFFFFGFENVYFLNLY